MLESSFHAVHLRAKGWCTEREKKSQNMEIILIHYYIRLLAVITTKGLDCDDANQPRGLPGPNLNAPK